MHLEAFETVSDLRVVTQGLFLDGADVVVVDVGWVEIGRVRGGGNVELRGLTFSSNVEKLLLFEDIPEERCEVRVIGFGVLFEVSYVVVTFLEFVRNAREEWGVMQALLHGIRGR